MDSGELLSDEMIMEMVAERLAEPDARARGFVLDGCPRTVHQAKMLAELLAPTTSTPLSTSRSRRPGACAPGRPAGLLGLRHQLLDLGSAQDQLDLRHLLR